MAKTYIGVDLSKDWLDIFHPQHGHQKIPNTASAIQSWLQHCTRDEIIVFEATSGCDLQLLRLASDLSQPFCRLNPLHAWHFGRSLNLPKTDRVDARMLARMGAERGLPQSTAHCVARAELRELHHRRDQLKRMETQEKNRLTRANSQLAKADIRASLRTLATRIAKMERLIEAFFADHPELAQQRRLLETIPGIGPVASVTLLSAMPELGANDRREIASLGGLAPRARESGKWRGQRRLGDGRRDVRRAMYMAALSTLSHGSFCPRLVAKMRQENRPGKVILIALARRLLVLANAILRDNQPYKHPA